MYVHTEVRRSYGVKDREKKTSRLLGFVNFLRENLFRLHLNGPALNDDRILVKVARHATKS